MDAEILDKEFQRLQNDFVEQELGKVRELRTDADKTDMTLQRNIAEYKRLFLLTEELLRKCRVDLQPEIDAKKKELTAVQESMTRGI